VLRSFIVEHDLVTIPGTEQAKVAEAPPYARSTSPSSISRPLREEPAVDLQRSAAERELGARRSRRLHPFAGTLLFTSVHEVWPVTSCNSCTPTGQLALRPAIRRLCVRRGLGHYSEEMMWEAGLGNGNPEIHIGQLQQR